MFNYGFNMPFQKGHKFAKGGARPNSGPKPSVVKALAKQAALETRAGVAIANIAKLQTIADDPQAGVKNQIQALIYLIDRELGKPKDPHDHSGEMIIKIQGYTPELAG